MYDYVVLKDDLEDWPMQHLEFLCLYTRKILELQPFLVRVQSFRVPYQYSMAGRLTCLVGKEIIVVQSE